MNDDFIVDDTFEEEDPEYEEEELIHVNFFYEVNNNEIMNIETDLFVEQINHNIFNDHNFRRRIYRGTLDKIKDGIFPGDDNLIEIAQNFHLSTYYNFNEFYLDYESKFEHLNVIILKFGDMDPSLSYLFTRQRQISLETPEILDQIFHDTEYVRPLIPDDSLLADLYRRFFFNQ